MAEKRFFCSYHCYGGYNLFPKLLSNGSLLVLSFNVGFMGIHRDLLFRQSQNVLKTTVCSEWVFFLKKIATTIVRPSKKQEYAFI